MQLSAKWIAFFLIVYLIGAYLGSTYDGYATAGTWAGTGSGGYTESPQDTVSNIMGANQANQRTSILDNIPIIGPVSNWFKSAYRVATWQFTFLAQYPMIQGLFTAFGSMAVLTLIMLVYGALRGNITWG